MTGDRIESVRADAQRVRADFQAFLDEEEAEDDNPLGSFVRLASSTIVRLSLAVEALADEVTELRSE
jgi:hypothetical protein